MRKIEALPPGLYEMKIDNPTGDPDCGHDAYSVRFEERRVEDVRFPADHIAFGRVADVSKHLDGLYSATLGKWVQAVSTPSSAAALEWLHPMRSSRYILATVFGPWQGTIAGRAASIANDRHAVSDGNPFKAWEIEAFDAVRAFIEQARRLRDLGFERWFQALYGGHVIANGKVESRPAADRTETSNTHSRPRCSAVFDQDQLRPR